MGPPDCVPRNSPGAARCLVGGPIPITLHLASQLFPLTEEETWDSIASARQREKASRGPTRAMPRSSGVGLSPAATQTHHHRRLLHGPRGSARFWPPWLRGLQRHPGGHADLPGDADDRRPSLREPRGFCSARPRSDLLPHRADVLRDPRRSGRHRRLHPAGSCAAQCRRARHELRGRRAVCRRGPHHLHSGEPSRGPGGPRGSRRPAPALPLSGYGYSRPGGE